MKFVDELRDPDKAQRLLREIKGLVPRAQENLRTRESTGESRPIAIMEVCGGHTHAIFRYGIEGMLPEEIELVHGPGCPVCVLPMGRVDDCIAIAERPEVLLATFGDALRVPGSRKSLLEAKAEGADVRTVYSPLDALRLAKENRDREVVFFGLGFETTMPSTALTILQAEAEDVRNFSLFCNHITILPTLKAILDAGDFRVDGFLGPGHLSIVIGSRPYGFIASEYRRPFVVTGFEPIDILQGTWMVVKQLAEGRCEVENQYSRVVREGGNPAAMAAIERVFELRESFEWRGLGSVPESGVRIREAYARFDAERRFQVPDVAVADPGGCQCGEVLKGTLKPWACQLFGKECTPESPMGALMVSSEGACAAYHRFGDVAKIARQRADLGLVKLGKGPVELAARAPGDGPAKGTLA